VLANATVWQVVAEHVGSFMFGVLVGLGAASRYRIVRIANGTKEGKAGHDATHRHHNADD